MSEQKYLAEFRKLFIDFLKHMHTSKEVYTANKAIPNYAISLYSTLKGADDDSWYLRIDPPWIVPITEDDYFERYGSYLVIGGEIQVEERKLRKYNFYVSMVRNSNSSEESKHGYLSCCEKDARTRAKSRIVRRFHFDTGKGIPEILEPRSHIQFGGICHEEQAIREYEGVDLHYCLDNKIRIPRFPYPPIDIVILLDILLRQFKTSIDRSFLEKPEWLKLVRRSEDLRLQRYYSRINEYYQGKKTNEGKKRVKLKTLFETLCENECIF